MNTDISRLILNRRYWAFPVAFWLSLVLPSLYWNLNNIDSQYSSIVATHLLVLISLSIVTLLFLTYLRRHLVSLQSEQAEQQRLMELRTGELRHEVELHRQTENRLRRFIEFSGEGIIVIDRNGDFTLCNPAALAILDYPDESLLIGKNIHQQLCPSSHKDGHLAPCENCTIRRSYRLGEAQHMETAHFCRSNGSIIPVEYRSQPLMNGEVILGAVITFADISERLAREQHLLKLSKALDYSPVAALITDRNGQIEYVNRRFIEACGYDTEELMGNTPRLFKSGITPPSTYEAMWQQLKRGEAWYGEFINRKKSGELFWDETAIAPIADKQGRVINYVAFKEDITRRKEAEKRVWEQANYDMLTELPNRHYFHDQLTQHVRAAKRYSRKFALMFLDLDGFKQVNDTLGHDVGDELLRQCAQRLKEHTRSSDIVSRLGGDEFTVIIPAFETSNDLVQVAQKIVEGIALPYSISDQKVSISTSLGIAIYPFDAIDSSTLHNMADSAMYAAKRRGKNRFMFYSNISSSLSFDLYSRLED